MRLTRAALRAQAQDDVHSVHEDADQQQDQETEHSHENTRPPLKDITDENFPNTESTPEKQEATPVKKAIAKKKSKTFKNVGTPQPTTETQQQAEMIHDDITSEDSPENQQSTQDSTISVPSSDHDMLPNTSAQTKSAINTSEPFQTPTRNVNLTSKTPKFDPEVHAPLKEIEDTQDDVREDSFVESIKTRSPTKMEQNSSEQTDSQDSFLEHIRSRTPAKMSPRIEDSVEAIDALEDAIEEVSGELPLLQNLVLDSPIKMAKITPKKQLPPSARKTALDTTVATKTPKTPKTQAKSPLKTKTSAVRGAAPRTSSGRLSTIKPTSKAPVINKAPNRTTNVVAKVAPVSTSQPPTVDTKQAEKQQPNVVKKRNTSASLSTSKPAFVPAKSSKPVTKSNFTLPGEAISTKLKAQREERAKREEEEAEKKKVFKSRPAPPRDARPSIAPRPNRTTSARLSLATNGSGSDKENTAPLPKAVVTKTPTTLSVLKARTELNKANCSVRRATSGGTALTRSSTVPRASLAPRVASLTTGQRSNVMKDDVVKQKTRGKEVFSRSKIDLETMNQERKEKEEAARKARAEAAEKGRLASREWAEKQKKRAATLAAVRTQQAIVSGTTA